MKQVFGEPKVFDVVASLENNGKLFATVNVGVHTSLLRAVYEPLLRKAFWLMGIALIVALLAAFLLSNLALRPLAEISRQLDRLTAAGGTPAQGEPAKEKPAKKQDVAALVSTKIEKIGQRMKNVEEVYSALRENLDQILGNLQDGILLFTEDRRAVLVSEAARRFLGIERDSILGCHARDIFDRSTLLGRPLCEAIEAGVNMVKEEIRTENGRRIQASVDFIYDDESRRGLGALVTLHDLESAAEIESELELSRRMAAIGRLTSGVGHEVKNPINAIVVHLELLKSKLIEDGAPAARHPAARHLEVIDAEIRRLDRVVQTLVDFSRPVELQSARAGSSPRHRRRAGFGRRGVFHAQCRADQPHAEPTRDRQCGCRFVQAGRAQRDPERRAGHARRRAARCDSRRRLEERRDFRFAGAGQRTGRR